MEDKGTGLIYCVKLARWFCQADRASNRSGCRRVKNTVLRTSLRSSELPSSLKLRRTGRRGELSAED